MGCLSNTSSVVGPGVLTAPLLLVRGLSKRTSRWFILNHQRHLQKLSFKRRQRVSRSESLLIISEPLVTQGVSGIANDRVRPVSDPCISSSSSVGIDSMEGILKRPRFPSPERCQRRFHPETLPGHSSVRAKKSLLACGCSAFITEFENPYYFSRNEPHEYKFTHNPHPAGIVTGGNCNCGSDTVSTVTYANISTLDDSISNVSESDAVYANIVYVAQICVNSEDDGTLSQEILHCQYAYNDGPGGLQQLPSNTNTSHSQVSDGLAGLQLSKSASGGRFSGKGSNGIQNRPPPPLPKPTSGEATIPKAFPGSSNNPPAERAPSVPRSPKPSSGMAALLPPSVESVSIGIGESIELTPLYRTLIDKPYFHLISRSKSKESLENATDGVFLIRPSTHSRDPLTLSLRSKGRTYNINIRQRNDGKFALGKEKPNETTFPTVDALVSSYKKEHIVLQGGDIVRLASSPEKRDHIYVKMPLSVKY